MPTDLNNIETIIVVMMENRSFDHMLGYLSLPDYGWTNVEGLKPGGSQSSLEWPPSFVLPGPYTPFRMPDPRAPLPGDPPHERKNIATQIGSPVPDGSGQPVYPMKGFVQSYPGTINVNGTDMPVVMGYFTGEDLPTYNFFVQNFTTCDHWFSSLPAGTQANRLMAMSGQSLIETNKSVLPDQHLVYDWLTECGIRWRVYHEGLPFFTLMPSCLDKVLDPNLFRTFEQFDDDFVNEQDATHPQVIFVEPRYTNAPHVDTPHDDHAPSAVDGGQRFLMEVYAAITANPARWSKSVMIVTYDEHGGFFDHVSPLNVAQADPATQYPQFNSTGVRVPAFVISPFVEPRHVFNANLDHTSILQLLGEKFGGGTYSDLVDARKAAGIGSVSSVLTLAAARADAPSPPAVTEGFTPQATPFDAMSQAFAKGWDGLKEKDAAAAQRLFPKLFSHFK
jgi:phospholipase C